MISVKANNFRFSPHCLAIAICFSFFSSASTWGQQMVYPPWTSDDSIATGYNYAVAIDVLANDFAYNYPIDPSSLTIVSQPASGIADFDESLEMLIYTPDENFAGYDQIQYKVADTQGNYSNVATVDIWVYNAAPSISMDYSQASGNIWRFFGTVSDENPGVCLVTFGGILAGKTTEVDQDGNYCLYVEMASGEEGYVTAQTTDECGEDSNLAEDGFYQY